MEENVSDLNTRWHTLRIILISSAVVIVFLLLDMEVLAVLVGLLSALVQVVYGEIQRSKHHILNVADVRLLDTQEVTEVQETIQQRQSWLETLQRYEEEKRRWEERQAQIEEERALNPLSRHDPLQNLVGPMDPRHSRGQLYFESAHLSPLEFPGLDGEVDAVVQEGRYKVEVGIDEELLPGPAAGEHIFRVAVSTHAPGKT